MLIEFESLKCGSAEWIKNGRHTSIVINAVYDLNKLLHKLRFFLYASGMIKQNTNNQHKQKLRQEIFFLKYLDHSIDTTRSPQHCIVSVLVKDYFSFTLIHADTVLHKNDDYINTIIK